MVPCQMKTRAEGQHLTFNSQYPIFFFSLFLIATTRSAKAGIGDFHYTDFIDNARSAIAEIEEFVPHYTEYNAEMVLKGMMYGRGTATDKRSSSYQKINFKEFLHVKGRGFAYSPRFISLFSDVSIGLQQQSRETDALGYRQDNGMFGFRQDIMVLPSHPYNLHLYAGRKDTEVWGQADTSSALSYQWGADANYKKRPWHTNLRYAHTETTTAWDFVTDSIGGNLSYFASSTLWNFNGSYNHFISSSYDDQSNMVTDVFGAHISKNWESFGFLSRWALDQNDQEDRYDQSILVLPDYNETRNRREWVNELTADLPLDVTSRLSYQKRNYYSEYQRGDRTGGATSDSDIYNLNFTHRLFRSLTTRMNNGYRTITSSGGETEQKDGRLSTDYSKFIRWGSFGAGLSGGIADTANVGGTTTLSETHFLTASSPTSFILASTQLDPESIRVSVIDVFNNNMVVPLNRDIHYTVIFLGESYRILMLAPPPSLTEPWTEYTYSVDYTNIASDYSIRNRNWGGTVRMDLFNRLLSPHAGYTRNDQQELDGFFPGILNNSTSYDVGLSSSYGIVQGDISKNWRTSTTENQTSLSANVSAALKFTQLSGGSCGVSYVNSNIEQLYPTIININELTRAGEQPSATSININELAQEENIYEGHVQAFTSWPQWQLNGSVGLNYSVYQGLGESTTRSITSGLTWHFGKMDITMRLAYHDSESEVLTSTSSSNYYTAWFMLRRKLF